MFQLGGEGVATPAGQYLTVDGRSEHLRIALEPVTKLLIEIIEAD
jgi:hypothetical protein